MAIKRSRSGKYPKIYANGYYGENDAGIPKEKGKAGQPDVRGFVGSGIKEYVFDNGTITRTIPAHNYKEALRMAKTLGFTEEDYRKRRHK